MIVGDWLLTPERAAVHRLSATAVVADLHLGYDLARRRGGEALPRFDMAETLEPLRALKARHGVGSVALAGDVFEAGWDCELAREMVRCLTAMGLDLVGVTPGNHDHGIDRDADWLPVRADGVVLGDWRVVHGDGRLPKGRVVHGHHHPRFRWGRVTAPCYLVAPDRLVLPAFSPDAQGVDVGREPSWRRYRCAVIAGADVLDLGELERLQPG